MKIRTVIFDIDNTLYSFTEANAAAIAAMDRYARAEMSFSEGEFPAAYKRMQSEILKDMGPTGSCRNRVFRFQRILEERGLPLSHALALYDIYWDTLLHAMRSSPGAEDVIRELKARGLRIGAGTDMTAVMQLRKLAGLHVLDAFDFMVTSEEAGSEKPAGAFFEKCLEKVRCCPEECLFVGDSPEKDVRGALGAGMRALLFAPGGDAPADAGAPAIRELAEVIDYL